MNSKLGATALVVALGLGLSALAPLTAQAADSGQITGRVRADNGTVIKGVTVDAISGGVVVKSTTSNSSGAYYLKGLAGATYILKYTDKQGRFLSEYFGDVTTADAATPIVLHDGEKRTGTSDRLTAAAKITGRAWVNTVAAETGLGAVEARLYNATGDLVAKQPVSPTFKFRGLTAGDYTLYFCTPNDDQSWLDCAFYNDQGEASGKSTISVGAGQARSGLGEALVSKQGAVLPTLVSAKVAPAKVKYGKHITVTATPRSYGDLSKATVSIQHHHRIAQTTSVVNHRATFTLSTKAWVHSKNPKSIKVIVNPTAALGGSSVFTQFRFLK